MVGILICGCFACPAADERDNIILFFKETLRSPSVIENFVGSQTRLRERELAPAIAKVVKPKPGTTTDHQTQFYHGARSGSNFFLRQLTQTNLTLVLSNSPMVIGRNGSKSYHLNLNTVTFAFQEAENTPRDPLKDSTQSFYTILCQFLNMGFGDIQAETVVWDGNQFVGKRAGGWPVYGALEVSNGLPATLNISNKKGDSPFKSFAYQYPDPPSSLDSFPESIIVSVLFKEGLQPWIKLSLLHVQVAKRGLAEGFFDEAKFKSTNISYVNVFTNGSLFELRPDGKMVEVLGATTVHARGSIVFYCLFAALTAAPILFWRFQKRRQNETTK